MEYLVVLAVVVYVYLQRDVWGARRRAEEGELPPIGYDRHRPIVVQQRGGMGPLGAGCLIVTFLLVLFVAATVGLPMLAVLYAVVKMPIWN